MTDVFISYTRKDRNRVRLIAHALAAEGFAVWWDPEIKPGAKWNTVIRKALESAAAVVTVWSKASAKSDWVLAETTHGSNRQALVPVMIQMCDPPMPFNLIQSADLTGWTGDGNDPVWAATLERVRALVEARRRLIAAAPPPADAHGAERAGASATGPGAHSPIVDAAFEEMHYRPAAARRGPRLLRIAAGGLVTAAVLTGGLWAAPGVMDAVRTQVSLVPAPAMPPPPSSPSPALDSPPLQEAVAAPDAPRTPETTASAEPVQGLPAASPPVAGAAIATTTGAATPVTATPTTPTPAPPQQTADATAALDACVNRLVGLCNNAAGAAPGFAADQRVSAQERAFLDRLMIVSTPPASPEAAAACASVIAQRQASPRRSGTLFDTACAEVGLPAPAPAMPPVLRDVITGIEVPRTQASSPTTMRLQMNSYLDADSMRQSQTGADVLFTALRSGAMQLAPANTAALATAGRGLPSAQTCQTADYTRAPITIDANAAGLGFCVSTGDGALVGVTIVAAPAGQPAIMTLQGAVYPAPR